MRVVEVNKIIYNRIIGNNILYPIFAMFLLKMEKVCIYKVLVQ